MNNLLLFVELNHCDTNVLENHLLQLVSSQKQEQIKKYKFVEDKILCLYADLIVRYVCCHALGLKNQDLIFSKDEFGKPYLAADKPFFFNVSHTKMAILVGFSEKPIGVDIEKVTSAELSIAKRFFHPNEVNYLLANQSKRNESFIEIWTQKEAYVKWLGKGLSMDLSSFDVTNDKIKSHLKTFSKGSYTLTLCSSIAPHRFMLIDCSQKQLQQLYSFVL